MKKILGKIVGLTLALLLAFAFAACDGNAGQKYPEVNNAGDAIGGAVVEMEKKDGFVVSVNATVTLPYIANLQYGNVRLGVDTATVLADVTMKKTATGYDYTASGTVSAMLTSGQVTFPVQAVKKGNTVYSRTGNGAWKSNAAEDIDLSLNQVAAAIEEAVAGWEYGGFEKEEDGYALSTFFDYGAMFTQTQSILLALAPTPIKDLVAAMAGNEEYTAESLRADVAAVLEDGNTLSDAVNALDGLLAHVFPAASADEALTVKDIADMLCGLAEYTAQDLYAQLVALGMDVKRPTALQTAYDYFMELMGGFDLDELIQMLTEGQSDLASVRNMLLTAVFEENMTVGDLLDMFAETVDADLRARLAYIAYTDMVDGAVLGTHNLALYEFGENSMATRLTLNKDLTVKNVSFAFKNAVTYSGQEFVKSSIVAQCNFAYTGMKEIVAPF